MTVRWQPDGIFSDRTVGMVSGDRCPDHRLDPDRHHQSWKDQYNRHGGTFCPDADPVQRSFSSVAIRWQLRQMIRCPLVQL